MLAVATDVLFLMTARQFPGVCSNVFRPVCCGCRRHGCEGVSEVTLGVGNLIEVTQVKVDGVVLDPSKYRVDDYRTLVRLPDTAGGNREYWPCTNVMDWDADQEDTWEVTASYGLMPSRHGELAAAKLACELAKAWTGGDCELSDRVRSVTRQGISEDFNVFIEQPGRFFTNGKTGIQFVDTFIATVNPHGLVRRPGVYSPDKSRSVRQAGTG